MPTIDYSSGKTFIEGFMVDTCTITRDPKGRTDDTFDPMTGKVTSPTPPVVVYTGKCNAKGATTVPSYLAGVESDMPKYKILLPISVINIRINDRLTVTNAVNDTYLLNRILKIIDVTGSVNRVYRVAYAIDITSFPVGE
jgi:hypothetical protein